MGDYERSAGRWMMGLFASAVVACVLVGVLIAWGVPRLLGVLAPYFAVLPPV